MATFTGYKNVLLPIDFTEHCERTATQAVWLARQSGGTVHLAHIVENPLDPLYKPEEAHHWAAVEHADAVAREMLVDAAKACVPVDVPHKLHLDAGDASEKLVELAAAISADLIVMSTHGTSSIADLLLGGTAEKVSRHAHCPVLLVRVPRE